MDFIQTLFEQPLAWAALALVLGWAWLRRPRRFKIITVIDGDTFVVIDRAGKRRKLRLAGVDAPEMDQKHGKQVREEVRRLIGQRWVKARLHGRDRYGRTLASIATTEGDLAAWMVRRGWAFALPGSGLLAKQALARLLGRGIWQSWHVQAPWTASSRNSLLRRLLRRRRLRRY